MTSMQNATEALENNDYRLNRLFNGYVFHIPEYQRFYSWDRRHWDDLWNDLLNIVDEQGRDHYMGTVICKDEERAIQTEQYTDDYREYGIVDGQQRFTTLILMVKAIISEFESVDADDLSEEAQEQYQKLPIDDCRKLFLQDPLIDPDNEGYEVHNKLKLQREDNQVFKELLVDDINETSTSTPSQQRLEDAYEFYEGRIEDLADELSLIDFLDRIGKLLSSIRSLQFMVYTIENQAQATLIFESINDRGKGLSNLDKTKSFLMHKVYLARSNDEIPEITIDGVQNRFGQIYRSLQTIETEDRTAGISEDRVQRYHYIATIDRSVNSTYINKETGRRNRTLPSGATVYLGALKWHFTRLHGGEGSGPHAGYSRDCIEEIDYYTDGLKRYYSHMESIATYANGEEYDSRLDWELRKLFALGRLGNFYPLLLTLWDEYRQNRLTASEMQEILQLIEVASFRIYSIADRRSDTGESRFYRIANDIATGDKDAEWIGSELKSAITSLEFDFAESLRDTNAYDRFAYKDIRYLFFNYDLFLRTQGMGGVGSSIEKAVENAGNNYTIEHIWPQDTSQLDLTEEEERIHEEIVHSLGNLTLVTGKRGSSWRNLSYSVKRERIAENRQDYLNSDFPMTRKLAREHETWGEQVIESRMDDLVEYAEKRWSLDAEERNRYASIRPSEIGDNH